MRHLALPAAAVLVAASLSACGDDRSAIVAPEGAASAEAAAGERAGRPEVHGTDGMADGMRTYEITLENLTPVGPEPGSSQVFSPPAVAAHNREIRMFQVGRRASEALAQIAEDGANASMLGALAESDLVYASFGGGGAIAPGETATYEITTSAGFDRLSMAFMLVNTNDGFSGVDALRFPRRGEETVYLMAYDAGSEMNTELFSDIPGPCCMGTGHVPTNERIGPHPGILDVGDLDPDVWGWEGPVAKLTIRRLNPRFEVTITNLTPAGSQVLSPPLLATHGAASRFFDVGGLASPELAALAEDGVTGPLAGALGGTDNVLQIVEGIAPIGPGESATFEIEGDRGRRYLSLAAMLVNTNDGFTALDSMELPRGGSVTVELNTWDAGSEENTELFSDIPGPCCMGAGHVPTQEPVRRHQGILGVGDLDPGTYGWADPSASVTVTRIR